jgi:hypothetical protein
MKNRVAFEERKGKANTTQLNTTEHN